MQREQDIRIERVVLQTVRKHLKAEGITLQVIDDIIGGIRDELSGKAMVNLVVSWDIPEMSRTSAEAFVSLLYELLENPKYEPVSQPLPSPWRCEDCEYRLNVDGTCPNSDCSNRKV